MIPLGSDMLHPKLLVSLFIQSFFINQMYGAGTQLAVFLIHPFLIHLTPSFLPSGRWGGWNTHGHSNTPSLLVIIYDLT